MKKGLSLPIEMIVIVAVAVLVLVVIAAFFTGGFMPTGDKIAIQNAFTQGCNYIRSVQNCDPNAGDFPVSIKLSGDNSPQQYSFNSVCDIQLGKASGKPSTLVSGIISNDCLRACGCPGVENQPQPVGT